MISKINTTTLAGKRVLVAPLDWGLGHATRCVPIIRDLLQAGSDVWLAGERAQEKLLREEFPSLPFLPLRGYRIKYARTGLAGKIIFQIPGILRSIQNENIWLQQQVKEYGIEAVISDNRYGLYHKNIFSIFITHQLTIKSPFGKWSEKILQLYNYKFINRFSECWVPDEAGEQNLAGELTHPEKLPETPVDYIGTLSRFDNNSIAETKGHLLIILSGPEPQRTLFEDLIIDQIIHYTGTAVIVRGLPMEKNIIPSTNSIKFYNHLTSTELNKEALKAEYIICRSGYSSVMDIAMVKKKSILVPTPGQTEQEYLASYLVQKKRAFSVAQNRFSLLKNLEEAAMLGYSF